MRVLHVISSISRQGGGPSRSSQGLVAGLRTVGVDAWLMTLERGEWPWVKGCDLFVNGGDFEVVLTEVNPDIVHLHGIWQSNLHRCAVICRRWGIPYVIAPRGMLEPWSLKTKWLKKRLARFLYQDNDLKKAAALHATAESEAEQFRKLGIKNYCIVSPNGVNVPECLPCRSGEVEKKGRRALFVSRMHKKKGVLELVESWARVKPRGWQCELVYTLNGGAEKAYEVQVKQCILDLGMSYQDKDGVVHSSSRPSVASLRSAATSHFDFILTGPLNDDAKWNAYARADLFVLPTYSENFGIVVAEALYAGVPVITTKGTPWSDLVANKCGWWIELPSEELESYVGVREWNALDSALREATSTNYQLPATNLQDMGANGRRLVASKYLWSAVVKPFIHGYEQVLNTCACAPCDTCRNYGDTCPMK